MPAVVEHGLRLTVSGPTADIQAFAQRLYQFLDNEADSALEIELLETESPLPDSEDSKGEDLLQNVTVAANGQIARPKRRRFS